MNRNLESSTQLTEFAPLSPEPHQPAVGLFLSRIFKFNRGGSPPESAPAAEGGGKDAEVPPWGQGETSPSAPNADTSSAPASSASAPPAAPFVAETDYRLPNVLRRMSSLLALNSSGLQAYKDSDFKQYWMPDSVSKECYDCGERFTTFRRRHHCRICGQIFCARCCRQEIPGKIMGCSGALRVCNYCSKVVLSYLQSADVAAALSADLRALSEDLRVRLGPGSGGSGGGAGGMGAPTGEAGPGASGEVTSPPGASGAADCGAGDGSAAARARRASQQEDRFGARGPPATATTSTAASQPRASVPQLSAEERSRALRRSSSLRALHAQLTRSPNALPVRPAASSAQSVERTLLGLRSVSRSASNARSPPAPGSFSGAELVDWLRARGHAASRAQASALAQALLDGGFLESASPVSPSPSAGGTPSPSSATSAGSFSNGLTVVFEDGPAAYRPLPAPPPPPPSPPAQGSRHGHGRASSGDSQDAWGVNDSLGTDSESECPAFDDEDEGVCNGVSSGNGNSNSSGGGVESSGVSEEVSPSASDGDRSLPSSGSTFYLDLNVEAGAVALSRPRPPPTATSPPAVPTVSTTNSAPRPRPPDAPPAPAPPAAQDADEQAARLRLEEAYAAHEALLLRQLLRAEGLSAQWEEVLLPLLAAAADAVRADPYAEMDVRKYVQLKKVSGGRRSDSRLVRGVVCSKNVAHRAMPRRLENARVLCVGGAIAFQRVEGRLQSLEPVLLGEREYLRHVVARLVAQNPSLVLVARGVARPAQELLLSAGVALALNVKPSVVARVARCTGADVLESADAQLARPRLGLARLFHLSTFRRAAPDAPPGDPNEPPPKTLMFLEGCKRERLGATVLLRGGSDAELARVKRVARLTLLARYGGRLEREFLLAEGARPPSPPAAPRFAAQDDDEEDEGPCRPASPIPVATSSPTQREESVEDSPESEDKHTKEVTKVDQEKEIIEKEEISEIELMDNSNESSKSQKEELELKNDDVKHEAIEEDQNDVQRQDSQGIGECEDKRDSLPEPPVVMVGLGDDSSGNGIAGGGSKALQAVTLRPRAASGRQDRSPGDDRRSGGGVSSTCTEAVSDFSDPLRCAAHEHPLAAPSAPGPPSAAPTPTPPVPPLSVATLPRDNRFREALAGTLLSGSPFLQFPVPRLETEAGRASALWRYLPRDLFWSAQFHPAGDGPTSSSNPAPSVPPLRLRSPQLGEAHPFVRARLTNAANTREVQALLAHFRACGGRLPQPPPCPAPAVPAASDGAAEETQMQPSEPTLPAPPAASLVPPPDALDPRNHQHLAVLYCSYALTHNAAPAYCLAPWVVHMDLYDSTSDMSLDRFLLRHCFPERFDCPSEECDAPLLQHVRRFVHDGVCLTLSLSPAPRTLAPAPSGGATAQGESPVPPPKPAATDEDYDTDEYARVPVLAWSWCARCQAASPAVPLSADARALSFAKFLELRFHAPAYRRRSASTCTHALHRDHVLCLARAGVVASFRYSQIQQWEVALPPPEVALGVAPGAAPQQRSAVIEELKQLALRGYELFSAVLDRLCALQAHIDVNALKAALAREKASYKTRIEEIQLRLTSPTLETRRLEAAGAATGAEPATATQAERDVQVLMWPIEDSLVCLKRGVADAVEAWNARLLDAAAAAAARRRDAPAAAIGASVAPPAAVHPTASVPPAPPFPPGAERPVSPAAEAGTTTPSPPPEVEDQLSAEERAVLQPDGVMLPEVEGGTAHGVVLIQPNDVPEATGPASRPSSVSDADGLTSSEVPDAGGSGSGVGSRGSASGRPLGVKSLLTQLLAGGGAGPALQSPLAPTEHPLAGPGWVPPVVIYEGEPSSVVAAALASPEYRRALDELRRVSVTRTPEQSQPSPLHKRRSGGIAASSPSPAPGAAVSDGSTASALGAESSSSAAAGTSSSAPLPLGAASGAGSGTAGNRRAGVLSFLRGNSGSVGGGGGVGNASRVDGVAYHRPLSIGSDQTTAASISVTGGSGPDGATAGVTPKDDDIMGSVGSGGGGSGGGTGGTSVSQHVEVTLSEGGALFFCRAYFAPAFATLRERLLPGGEEAYARSLTRCVHWAARGGKSGSAFCKTRDDRFVLKEMSRMEMQLFLDFANHYFAHVHSSLSANRAMLLGKIVGVYRIKVRSASGSTMASNLLVMENLFFRRHVTHKFDLKGSMRNRLAETLPEQGSGNGELVLLDENLLKMTCDSPLYVYPHSKAVLMQAIHNDTQFLAAQDVMDYSLLVGLDEDRHELVVGIIDYIRTFTWDKKLEAMVKYYGGLGGGQARLPTVVSPELYRSRFVKAMHQYFLPVPDRWTHLGRGLMEGAY